MIDRLLRSPSAGLAQAAAELGLVLTPANSLRLAQEQLRMVLLHTRVGTVAASGFAVMLAVYLMQQVGQPGVTLGTGLIQLWLGLKLTVAAARIRLAQA